MGESTVRAGSRKATDPNLDDHPTVRDASGAHHRSVTEALSSGVEAPAVRRFQLQIVENAGTGAAWESVADRCSIGTDPANDLVLVDQSVSGFHCEIRIGPEGARIRDLNSRNGTFLDGVRIYDAAPRGGSLVRIGRTVLRFQFGKSHNRIPVSERTSFGSLLGSSLPMRAAYSMLERAAASDATVLIEGETGTGKEGAARSIHEASDRREKPFVIVDCAAIPANLLESELFGHEKGAYTGASDRRIGAFEEASGGTIFLDEIGELPGDLQPKLLRVLEQREVRRIGSSAYRKVDVRLIAATNRDLRGEVNAGRFRADVFFRLSVIKILLPPLRERLDDLPTLVPHLINALGSTEDAVSELVTPELLRELHQYAWGGNVRELRNYLERCLVMRQVLPLGDDQPSRRDALRIDPSMPFTAARQAMIAEFERRYVEALMTAHKGRMARAARAAGIGRAYFHKLVTRHGLK